MYLTKKRASTVKESMSASTVMGVDTNTRVDRFSQLPDGVAHHILSFFGITDLTSFRTVSRRCRQLYLSTPSLKLDTFELYCLYEPALKERLRLFSSLDRFLILRGDNKIQHFSLCHAFHKNNQKSPCCCDDEMFRIITWINNAVRCKVEVLELSTYECDHVKPFVFPSCVFLCKFLRSLRVSLTKAIIKAPSLAFASNLECLNLINTRVDECFFKWMSSSCKHIEKLRLQGVSGSRNITVESSSLKSFYILSFDAGLCDLKISGEKLEDIRINWWVYTQNPDTCESLSIFAPNLKYLEWFGNKINHQVGKLLHLEEAKIDLDPENDLDKLFDVLRSINRVKVLTLHEATIMALFKVKEGSMPAPWNDISCLHMNIGSLVDNLVPAMVSLFRGMRNLSNLSTLYIMAGPNFQNFTSSNCSAFDMGYWKSENLALVSQLKKVTMDLSELSIGSNGIEFSRFILEHAQNLKEMVIVLPYELPQEYINNLNKSKTTSNATVVFREKGKEGRGEKECWF